MRAGRLRHRVELLRPQITRDALGAAVTEWVPADTVWAGVEPLVGRELHAARQEHSEISVRVVMRYRADVAADWRLRRGAETMELVAPPINPDMRNRELQLMCRVLV